MRNFLGYTILLGTFFGMLMIGGCIVTGYLSPPVAGALTVIYALVGLFSMWLCWRKPRYDMKKAAIYYSQEGIAALKANLPFLHLGEGPDVPHPALPEVRGERIQFVNYIPQHVQDGFVYSEKGLKAGEGEKEL